MRRVVGLIAILSTAGGCVFGGGSITTSSDSDSGGNVRDAGRDATVVDDASGGGRTDAAADAGTVVVPDTGDDAGVEVDTRPSPCGDGVVDGPETCDPGIADVAAGGCPQDPVEDCPSDDRCVFYRIAGTAGSCSAECVVAETIATCNGGDGCCPEGCDATSDDDCPAQCGNMVQEDGEICDGNCPIDCDDNRRCTADAISGGPETCDAVCINDPIVACIHGDGCCPDSCDQTTDDDCSATCGDNVVDDNETCDGNCPNSCPDVDGNACTVETLVGSATSCTAECATTFITTCIRDDGCCPDTCNASNDNDCPVVCGNMAVEGTEICDGNCPTSCNDGNACTDNVRTGSAATCDAQCSYPAITQCIGGDGCCDRDICDEMSDSDCAAVCDNGVVEPGETCDGDCPASCDDGLDCTSDTRSGTPAQCNVTCTNDPIVACGANEGCCPDGCDASNDGDCPAMCGNNVLEPGEQCDPSVGANTCASLGLGMGMLSCNTATCRFDTSNCLSVSPMGADHLVFATSTAFRGNGLGGVARADNLCNIAAAGSSKADGRSYVALISDSKAQAHPKSRLVWGSEVENTGGQTVRFSTAWPWSTLMNPINRDEDGTLLPTTGSFKAWTGADATGTANEEDCRDPSGNPWRGIIASSGTNNGAAGRIHRTDNQWINGGGIDSCDAALGYRLYCVSAKPQPDIYIFATSRTYTGGGFGGVTGADKRCQEAGETGSVTSLLGRDWFAVMGDQSIGIHADQRSRWTSSEFGLRSVKNTDGTVVENNSASWPWTLESKVTFDENGNALDATRVWTGAISSGQPHVDQCDRWSSSSALQFGRTGRTDSASMNWLGDSSLSCDNSLRLFCMSR